jgi:hypothetical protein
MPVASARVAYALLDFHESRLSPEDWAEALRSSLVPGARVERYGRRWFMAQHADSGRWIAGRLAFEAAGEESGIWDEESKDVRMIDTLGTAVQVVPFVIDTQEHRAAFELRAQTVRPGTFQGNFQALLQKASNLPWRVTLEGVKQPPWEQWRGHVERLVAVWITIQPPNPHSPMEELEEVFDKGVETATISALGDDIDLEGSELLEAAFGHASDYGKITAHGIVTEGTTRRKEEWQSKEEGGVRKDDARRDESGRVPIDELKRLLRRRSKEAEE